MQTLKISKVGDSLSIILSSEILRKLQVGEGDSIVAIALNAGFANETIDGIKLIADDSERVEAKGMKAYGKVVDKYSNALEIGRAHV